MKDVIVLPGAEAQIPLIKRLKAMGLRVTVFGPAHCSPAFKYADDVRDVDILNREKCLDLAKKIKPACVMSDMCDIAMPTVAYLSQELNIPGLSPQSAALFTNKELMRQFCLKNNLPSPKFRQCTSVQEAIAFFHQVGKKCILKPLDSNSSRGVFTIWNDSDIYDLFEQSLAFSKCNSAVLIEEYIEGTEFTVDGIMTPNGHISLAISEKKHYKYNPNIAYELFFSHSNPSFDYDLLKTTNNRFVNLAELKPGCFTHAEYKFHEGQYYLIEIGARGGGNFISSDIVPTLTGVDNYKYLIRGLVDGSFEPISLNNANKGKCVVLYFFDVENEGRILRIENEDLLRNNSKIIRYNFNFKIGDTIKRADNDSARVGYYIAYGSTREELRDMMAGINSKIKFIIE